MHQGYEEAGGVRRIGGLVVGLTMAAMGLPAAATATEPPQQSATAGANTAVPGDVELVDAKESLLGTHLWYRQTFDGVPVIDGYYARHLDRAGRFVAVDDGRMPVRAELDTTPTVRADAAVRAANRALTQMAARRSEGRPKPITLGRSGSTSTPVLAVRGGAHPALVWSVTSTLPGGTVRTLVDARSARTLGVRVMSQNADGKGTVFDPNPVVTLRDESLKDRRDADQDVLFTALRNVILRHLDGNGRLAGDHARIVRARGGLAREADNEFLYRRSDDRFEQVMSYYHVTQAQDYIQSLGFDDVNNESQDLIVNTFAGDNSFYDSVKDTITLGRGGVDDAEDAEVIWHEYGHAIQDDQVPGFGSTLEAGSIGEGFGDYWAVTMSVPVSRGFELPCVMDWDATSYTSDVPHCLRRTDTGKTTDDVEGEVHVDGEIWSQALWNLHQILGRNRANRLVLESQFFFSPRTSFAAAARDTVATARGLYGQSVANVVREEFQDRKILPG